MDFMILSRKLGRQVSQGSLCTKLLCKLKAIKRAIKTWSQQQEDFNNPHMRAAVIKKKLDDIHNKLNLDPLNSVFHQEEKLLTEQLTIG